MALMAEKVGAVIASLRKNKGWTQNELGDRLCISFQAVSKWERGETLPDTAILVELANVLDTTVDNILGGGEKMLAFKGKLSAKDAREGINCLERIGILLGKQNLIYRHAVDGISGKMNTDIDAMLSDDFLKECLTLEAMLHNMKMGYYYDPADVKNTFKHDKWYNIFCDYAKKYDMG